MTLFQAAATLITLAALFSYVNHRFLKLPPTIGIMVMSLGLSLLVALSGFVDPTSQEMADTFLTSVDFNKALMQGMLGFLLFAGALHVDLEDLAAQKGVIFLLATVGVLLTTVIIGYGTKALVVWLGLDVTLMHCLLFGALISPTDPIAVLAILKQVGTPKRLETAIAGESLFNDGVGVVVFLTLLGAAGLTQGQGPVTAASVAKVFAQEAVGGAVFGLGSGYVAYWLLRSVDQYQVEILLSLALVTGGYAAANALHLSGPIAMVVAGLLIGNRGRRFAMSDQTRTHLDTFWELIDEVLNAVLFVLIGLETLILRPTAITLALGLAAIPLSLAARFIAVSATIGGLKWFRDFTPHAIKVMTWAGLRGGISVALALWLGSLLDPAQRSARDLLLVMTYVVVIFSILVQGLSIKPILRGLGLTAKPKQFRDPTGS